MKILWRFMSLVLMSLSVMAIIGCANNQQGYQQAFNAQNALTNNQASFTQSFDAVFKIVKQVLIQQGFTVESADSKSGIIKAVRNMQDKEDSEISYSIHTSADISEVGNDTNVTLSASQQTILHRATTTWWHLLWILPVIPTGTEYQTLVIKEGNITDPGFYSDFLNSLKISVTKYEQAVKIAAAKAAEKAEAERLAAEKAAKIKAEAEAIAAAKKAEAERVAAEAAAKVKAEAAAKAAAEKAEADAAARLKAEAEAKAAAEKAETERAAAEAAAKIKADAEAKALAEDMAKIDAEKKVVAKETADPAKLDTKLKKKKVVKK